MMKPSTDDKMTGKVNEIKGTIQATYGQLTDNPDLAADGGAKKNAGKLLNWIGKVEEVSGE